MTNPNDSINVVIHPVSKEVENLGLSKREYFAAMAMQGILSNTYRVVNIGDYLYAINNIKSTEQAVLFADSLIEALNKTEAK